MDTQLQSIQVNGINYVRADQVTSSKNTLPSGNRHVVVVDRGWIWAGDLSYVEEFGQKYIVLSDAINLFGFNSIGFTGALKEPKSSKVTLKPSEFPVKIPLGSVISLHPVNENWGK